MLKNDQVESEIGGTSGPPYDAPSSQPLAPDKPLSLDQDRPSSIAVKKSSRDAPKFEVVGKRHHRYHKAVMDDQGHRPHRKAKEKKKHSGGKSREGTCSILWI